MNKVFILAGVEGNDLVFRVAPIGKELSPLFRRPNEAKWVDGNPYSIYGKEAAEYVGKAKGDLTFVVLQVTSGPENALN